MSKIAIIGSGPILSSVERELLKSLENVDDEIIIMESENIPKYPFDESLQITNPYLYPELSIYGHKQFVCKGKHQYREVEVSRNEKEFGTIHTEWICQCGRKL